MESSLNIQSLSRLDATDPMPKNLSMDDLLCDLEEENDGDED